VIFEEISPFSFPINDSLVQGQVRGMAYEHLWKARQR